MAPSLCRHVVVFRSTALVYRAFRRHKHSRRGKEPTEKGVSPLSTEDNKAYIRRGYEEGFYQMNLAVFDELLAPDYVWHLAETLVQGREPAKQLISRFLTAFPDGRYTIEDMIAEGDRVVVRQTFRGTHQGDFMGIAPTGKQVSVTEIEIFRVANGKGVENWTNSDDLGLLQQLGVVLSMG